MYPTAPKTSLMKSVLGSCFIHESILDDIQIEYYALSRQNLPEFIVWYIQVSLA